MDRHWGWDGKDNVEADLRFIMLPPTCEAGYFYPGGVYEVNHYFFVLSQFYLTQNFPLCASHFLPCFLFSFSSALVSWLLLLYPFSLFITRARWSWFQRPPLFTGPAAFSPWSPNTAGLPITSAARVGGCWTSLPDPTWGNGGQWKGENICEGIGMGASISFKKGIRKVYNIIHWMWIKSEGSWG